jgi:hypothetical protein
VRQKSPQPIPGSLAPLLDQRVLAEREELRKLKAELAKKAEQVNRCEERVRIYEQTLELERLKSPEIALGGVTDKWKVFERFCEAHRYDGFTRPQLVRFLRDKGIKCGKNFSYQAVKKFGNRMIQNGDRFFLKDGDTVLSVQGPENHPRPIGELIGAVRRIIQALDLIDSGTVYRSLKKERFEFWSKKPNSSIVNILRKLADKGELEKVSDADELHPAYYRKVVDAESSGRSKRNVKIMRPAS